MAKYVSHPYQPKTAISAKGPPHLACQDFFFGCPQAPLFRNDAASLPLFNKSRCKIVTHSLPV